jgi:hypothetical protein
MPMCFKKRAAVEWGIKIIKCLFAIYPIFHKAEFSIKLYRPAPPYLFVGQIGASDRSYPELWLTIAHHFPLQASSHG